MKYLKKITAGKNGAPFLAEFTNGTTTTSHAAACYFMAMQDKDIAPRDLAGHVKIGEIVDAFHDWTEIKRIAETFTSSKGAAA